MSTLERPAIAALRPFWHRRVQVVRPYQFVTGHFNWLTNERSRHSLEVVQFRKATVADCEQFAVNREAVCIVANQPRIWTEIGDAVSGCGGDFADEFLIRKQAEVPLAALECAVDEENCALCSHASRHGVTRMRPVAFSFETNHFHIR